MGLDYAAVFKLGELYGLLNKDTFERLQIIESEAVRLISNGSSRPRNQHKR